ncbi:HotDog domain-containing protein [Durotheca rogersii]|uniref:HotDog domain-containing protein n=1 Tax=Durotheca rogersii TaxID=419775 RepID=UPI0022211DC3|nr:HotDog domain-containing protein [Durotheca rogersii]KAI5857445.1 HotDog domain-containing protein [Durotheca rogersii]
MSDDSDSSPPSSPLSPSSSTSSLPRSTHTSNTTSSSSSSSSRGSVVAGTPPSDYEHFLSIPWCAARLQGPGLVVRTPPSRTAKADGEDALFGETLRSRETVLAMAAAWDAPGPGALVDAVTLFLTLGPGLAGHAGACHGGAVAALLDEAAGLLATVNLPAAARRRGASAAALPPGPYVTAYLNTTYLRPVPTCATVLARARFLRVEGRKYLAEAWIEDVRGRTLAHAEALYVRVKSVL